jgi:hypothetical protein
MQQLSDPPSAAQVAQMLERLTNVVDDLKEIKGQQAEMNRHLAEMVGVQRDISHLADRLDSLSETSKERAKILPAMDGRIKSLERWHKFVWAAILTSASLFVSVVGWSFDKIAYLYRMDSRLTTLELIVNGHGIEHAMTPEDAPKRQER